MGNFKNNVIIFLKKWYKVIFIAILCLISFIVIISNRDIQVNSNNIELNNVNVENQYVLTTDYDGIYKFSLDLDDDILVDGIISFKNGNCKVKYIYTFNNQQYTSKEFNGVCGLRNSNKKTFFYFTVNKDDNLQSTYKCANMNGNIICELESNYDLYGGTNKDLELIRINSSQDMNTIFEEMQKDIAEKNDKKEAEEKARKEAEEKAKKEQEEKEFKESCKTYTFEQMARNPDNFRGTNVKLTGEVVQVMTESNRTNLRVNITKTGTYSTYYTDTVYVVYYQKSGEDKILEDDIITIYGTSQGDYSYITVLGSTVTLPSIYAKYITIDK